MISLPSKSISLKLKAFADETHQASAFPVRLLPRLGISFVTPDAGPVSGGQRGAFFFVAVDGLVGWLFWWVGWWENGHFIIPYKIRWVIIGGFVKVNGWWSLRQDPIGVWLGEHVVLWRACNTSVGSSRWFGRQAHSLQFRAMALHSKVNCHGLDRSSKRSWGSLRHHNCLQ